MTYQLPTPTIELLFLQFFLGSLTFLGLIVLLAWLMKKQNVFSWKTFLLILMTTFVLGNAGAILIWIHWPFSFDIMFGPIYWPGLVAYSSSIGIGLYTRHYFTSRLEK